MNAVYQSNVGGTVLNQPFDDDLANTETLPVYMLSTWLFQSEMKNSTGYSIVGLNNANLTSIHYSKGTLLIGAVGKNDAIVISHESTAQTFRVNGFETIPVSIATVAPFWVETVLAAGIVLAIAGLASLGIALRTKRKGPRNT